MKAKKAIKELEKQLRKDPESLVLRLKLAAVYREVGRTEEAVRLYGSVAVVYHEQGRLSQAIAVCKSVLEIDPSQRETQGLLAELDRMRAAQGDGAPQAPLGGSPASTRQGYFSGELPDAAPSAATDEYEVEDPVPIPSLAAAVAPMPVRVSPVEDERKQLAREFSQPSGLTPHTAPNPFAHEPASGARPGARRPRPPTAPPELHPRTSTPLPRMARTTQRMAAPPVPMRRQSGPLLTPTPLPQPLALHDVPDEISVHPRPLPPSRPLPPLAPPPVDAPPPPRTRPPTSPPPAPRFGHTLRGQLRVPLPGHPVDDAATSIAADDDALTRIADAYLPAILDAQFQVSDEAMTTIAPDVTASPAPLPNPPLEDDEAVTRIADESGGWPMNEPAPKVIPPRRASIFERDTRPIDAVAKRELQAELLRRADSAHIVHDDDVLEESQPMYENVDEDEPTRPPMEVLSEQPMDIEVVDDDELPTHPPSDPTRATAASDIELVDSDDLVTPTPARGSAIDLDPGATGKLMPVELRPFQRGGRLLDVEPQWPEEDTDPRSADSDGRTTGVAATPRRPGDEADDSLSLVQAFNRPFSETLRALGPDGSAIEGPLSFFSDLPEDALAEMAEGMLLRTYRAGEAILQEGDPGDACFVIASGEVRVLKRDPMNPRGDLIEVTRLASGALFGEFALLADRRRHATVQAIADAEIYEIPRRLLRELAATFPDVGPLLESFYRERLLATLLVTAPFFRSISEERRGDLLALFKPRRAESGEHIITEGDKAGGLFLIVLGSVEITKRVSSNRSVLLATLGEGAYFGEMSLLKGGVASASVRAAGPTELAILPPRAFYDIVSHNPMLWDEVRREANRRKLETNQIVTGETNVV